jgi:hypothetical protein
MLTCCRCRRNTGAVWRLVDHQRLCEMCAAELEGGIGWELEIITGGSELPRPVPLSELHANLQRAAEEMRRQPVREETPEELDALAELEDAMIAQHENEEIARLADRFELAVRRYLGGASPKYMLDRIGAAGRLVEQRFRDRVR